MGELVVTLEDVRASGQCFKGGRLLARRLGLDWEKLRTEGLPLSSLESFDRPEIKRVCRKTRERYARLEVENG